MVILIAREIYWGGWVVKFSTLVNGTFVAAGCGTKDDVIWEDWFILTIPGAAAGDVLRWLIGLEPGVADVAAMLIILVEALPCPIGTVAGSDCCKLWFAITF